MEGRHSRLYILRPIREGGCGRAVPGGSAGEGPLQMLSQEPCRSPLLERWIPDLPLLPHQSGRGPWVVHGGKDPRRPP